MDDTFLQSRKFSSPEDFLDSFIATITPGIIPSSEFIKWHLIFDKIKKYEDSVEFYRELATKRLKGESLSAEFADALLSTDEPEELIRCAFEILGHTASEISVREDFFEIGAVSKSIHDGDESAAKRVVNLLEKLGFFNVLGRNISDFLFGVQLGLETHRRKNTGGVFFHQEVRGLLENITSELQKNSGREVTLAEEEKVVYGNRLSKKLDFCIQLDGENKWGVEVNFYTVSGSKPTEIKRSYGNIRMGLQEVGMDLIWVTDGKGYYKMKRSLRDAYVIFPNIYNLQHVKEHLANDLQKTL